MRFTLSPGSLGRTFPSLSTQLEVRIQKCDDGDWAADARFTTPAGRGTVLTIREFGHLSGAAARAEVNKGKEPIAGLWMSVVEDMQCVRGSR